MYTCIVQPESQGSVIANGMLTAVLQNLPLRTLQFRHDFCHDSKRLHCMCNRFSARFQNCWLLLLDDLLRVALHVAVLTRNYS